MFFNKNSVIFYDYILKNLNEINTNLNINENTHRETHLIEANFWLNEQENVFFDKKSLVSWLDYELENNSPQLLDSITLNNETLLFNSELDFIHNFFHLRTTAFKNFFINNSIDIPLCFQKSRSLYRRYTNTTFLKLINCLMRKGKKEQMTIIFNKAFSNCINNEPQNTKKLKTKIKKWKFFFSYFSSFLFDSGRGINSLFLKKTSDTAHFTLILEPIFSFSIYNVDKNIRKFSRGKSGKYVFVWKYVPQYKRKIAVIKWIMKSIKFTTAVSFKKKIEKCLLQLFFQNENNFLFKTKNYAYNYVMKNLKKKLMSTLKTTF